MGYKGTELLIRSLPNICWQVIQRPIGEGPETGEKIKLMMTAKSFGEALLWAEGRKSVSGQPIKVSG